MPYNIPMGFFKELTELDFQIDLTEDQITRRRLMELSAAGIGLAGLYALSRLFGVQNLSQEFYTYAQGQRMYFERSNEEFINNEFGEYYGEKVKQQLQRAGFLVNELKDEERYGFELKEQHGVSLFDSDFLSQYGQRDESLQALRIPLTGEPIRWHKPDMGMYKAIDLLAVPRSALSPQDLLSLAFKYPELESRGYTEIHPSLVYRAQLRVQNEALIPQGWSTGKFTVLGIEYYLPKQGEDGIIKIHNRSETLLRLVAITARTGELRYNDFELGPIQR